MKVKIWTDSFYPQYRMLSRSIEDFSFTVELTEEEIEQIKKAEEMFEEAQYMLRSKTRVFEDGSIVVPGNNKKKTRRVPISPSDLFLEKNEEIKVEVKE